MQVGLGCLRELIKPVSKLVSGFPLWVLLEFLLEFLLWVPSVMDCGLEVSDEINLFLLYVDFGRSNRKQMRTWGETFQLLNSILFSTRAVASGWCQAVQLEAGSLLQGKRASTADRDTIATVLFS